MALSTVLADASRNAAVDAVTALCNSGYLRIYDGAQPATADTAITTQNLLVEVRFANPAFGAAAAGVATANTLTSATVARTGVAAWYRITRSDGTTAVLDADIGSDLALSDVNLIAGAQFTVTSYTHRQETS